MKSPLIAVVVLGLTACAGKQHIPPAADSGNTASVSVAGPLPSGMAVTKLTLNRKQCYQGLTEVPGDTDTPMRIASGEASFFSARYDRLGSYCDVVVSFSPEAQTHYVLLPHRDIKVLGSGTCGVSVVKVLPDGKRQPQPLDRWVMRSASIACIRPRPSPGG